MENQVRNIAEKKNVWDAFIKKGILLPVVYDVETFGLARQDVPHPVRGTPIITEYAHVVMDIAGNYVDKFQVFPKRPETEMGDPAAPIVTRKFPQEFDDASRTPYMSAMSQILWELERVPFRYAKAAEKLGDGKRVVSFRKFNVDAEDADMSDIFNDGADADLTKAPDIDETADDEKGERNLDEEEVIEIPLKDANGNIVHDVRYHPQLGKVAFRVDDDPSSPYSMPRLKNNYYIDEADGSKWKLAKPRKAIFGFNSHGFDNAVMRVNFMRAGMHPEDLFFMTTQSSMTNKQSGKGYSFDMRNVYRMALLYGPQGDERLRLSERINPVNGRPYISESLTGIMKVNTRSENTILGTPRGILMPDGSIYDENAAHGALYDAFATQALYQACMQTAPNIVGRVLKQSDGQYLQNWLTNTDAKDNRLPLFSLSVKNYPHEPYETLYAFLGTDVDLGNMKKYIFIKTDGTLHQAKHNGKAFLEFSEQEWTEYLTEHARDTDAMARLVPARKWPYALHMNTVLRETAAGGKWRNDLDAVEQDLIAIKDNPQMLVNLRNAVENINYRMKQKPSTQNPSIEDDLYKFGFGEPPYISGIEKNLMETVHAIQSNEHRYLKLVDENMYRLFIGPHPVDYIEASHPEAKEIISNYVDLTKRVRGKFTAKKIPYAEVVKSYMKTYSVKFDEEFETKVKLSDQFEFMANEQVKAYYGKVLQNLRAFRWGLKDLFLRSERHEILQGSDFARGMVTVNDIIHSQDKKRRILISNAYRGDNYSTPQIVDAKSGAEVSLDFIEKQDRKAVFDKFKTGEWVSRFYRARSNPAVAIVLCQYADAGKLGDLAPEWQQEYKRYRQLRLYGKPNENEITSTLPTVSTFEYGLKKIEVNASLGNPEALERSVIEMSGMAFKLDSYDEAKRIISANRKWIEGVKKAVPYESSLEANGLYDPKTSMPYDYIPYEIASDDYVVLDVPAKHLRNPIEQFGRGDLPHKCLVLPKPNIETARAIKKGVKVILREEETGRLYHSGPAVLIKAPKDGDPSAVHLNGSAMRAYAEAGSPYPAERIILGIEGLYPIANSRYINPDVQTFKLPRQHFDGLVYHEAANLPKNLCGLIVPADSVAQALTPGKMIRLREAHGELFDNVYGDSGDETGHIYDTKLKSAIGVDEETGKVNGITLKKLFSEIAAGRISEKVVINAGFQSMGHLEKTFSQFAANLRKDDYEKIPVVVLEFTRVNKENWGYWNPPEAPKAAMLRGKAQVPPSAYRNVFGKK